MPGCQDASSCQGTGGNEMPAREPQRMLDRTVLPPSKKACKRTHLPNGPTNYEECLHFASDQLDRMLSLVDTEVCESVLARNFVMTTDYSGMGCAEMAIDCVLDPGAVGFRTSGNLERTHVCGCTSGHLLCWFCGGQATFLFACISIRLPPMFACVLACSFALVRTVRPGSISQTQLVFVCFRACPRIDEFHSHCPEKSQPRVCQDAMETKGLIKADDHNDCVNKYRCADIEESCREVLLSHPANGDFTLHVQGDILHRIKPEPLSALRVMVLETPGSQFDHRALNATVRAAARATVRLPMRTTARATRTNANDGANNDASKSHSIFARNG